MRRFPRCLVLELLLPVLLVIIMVCSSHAVSVKTRAKKKMSSKEMPKQVNICEIEGQQAPIYCYCYNGRENATSADCWVLSRFERINPIWDSFKQQNHLQKLTFTVRQVDSLDYVPTQVLRDLKNLRTVVIQYARLTDLPERIFSNLTVSEINLIRNAIETLHKYAFENMPNLTLINLEENRITEINR